MGGFNYGKKKLQVKQQLQKKQLEKQQPKRQYQQKVQIMCLILRLTKKKSTH